jgi:tetratricopeptide (TPR) repeat protein
MPESALETELNIDPQRFETVFSQVWGDDEDPDDRVHIDTEVESEIIRVVEDWVDHVHDTAESDGSTNGLFLVIEGAQATGKTTMTRFIKNSLDPVEQPGRRDIPMIIPIWDSTDPNPTPYKYRGMLNSEGRRVFEELEDIIPSIDDKISALNSMSAELTDDQVQRLSDEEDVPPEKVRSIFANTHSGGDVEPKEVVSKLAQEGYVFTFIFDEMVSSSDKEEAQSVLKWFKDHLYPYVGLVLFCHPDVSDAIRSEMQDQARRRNFDATLEIGGQTYDIKEDIVVDIRGMQDRIIDLEQLLKNYFQAVSLDGASDDYGPFGEGNIEWMKGLLEAGGLIGNLIDGINPAVKNYAQDLSDGDDDRRIGVYLFDQCSRSMGHVRLRQRLDAHTSLDPRADDPTVWRAKELITGSVELGDLDSDELETLKEHRVVFEDTESGEFEINESLIEYGRVDIPSPTPTTTGTSEDDLLDVYNETLRAYSDQKTDPDEREELRRNLEIGAGKLVGFLNSRQVNVTKQCALSLPGQSRTRSGYMELKRTGTGTANRLDVSNGEFADYGYSFLTYAMLDDESLSDPSVRDNITDLHSDENGIIILTDKAPEDLAIPDWFSEEIDGQHWNDPGFEWGDIIEFVHVNSLSEVLGVYRHIEDRSLEDDSEVLSEIDRLNYEQATPPLRDLLEKMYTEITSCIRMIHSQIYSKYDGPTLPEAEAFATILEEVQEHGFISEDHLDSHREEFGVEISSLVEKDAIITVESGGEEENEAEDEESDEPDNAAVFLKKDFGAVSKLAGRNVSGADDLFPVPPAIFEELEEFREMEDNPGVYGDDDIEDALSNLEDKHELVDYFLFDESKIEDIKDAIEDEDIDAFNSVVQAIQAAQDTEEEDFTVVSEELTENRELWDQIKALDIDSEISPIHRGLFFAQLHQSPPSWAEEYLEQDSEYPDLIYRLHGQITSVLEKLDQAREQIEDGFDEESESVDELREELADFLDVEVEDDEGETTDLDLDRLQEKDLDELRDVEFSDWIEAVADTERKRKKINQAFAHLTSAKNAIDDDFKEGLEIESLDEIDADVAEDYLPISRAIAEQLIIGDIVFQEGDRPSVVVGEFEQFCEHLKQLIKQTEKKAYLEQKKDEEWDKLEDIEGDSIEDKRSQIEQKEKDFEEAEDFLKLKEGHCEVCKTEWENLNEERQAEITDRIEEIEGTYDVSLSLDSIEDDIETAQSQQGTIDDVERNLDGLNDELDDVEIVEHKESLDDLKEKYCSED